jgi:hypothetical protein
MEPPIDEEHLRIQHLVADFMGVSTKMERHLQQRGPLTQLQVESLTLTISSLQTFLDTWKEKRG